MIRASFILVVLMSCSFFLQAQQAPISNVYVFNLKVESDSVFNFSKPRYLTEFNKNGYNNQPEFFSNDELYISVKFPYEDQHEIYALDLKKKTKLKNIRYEVN